MPLTENKWINELIAIGGAIAAMILLDWLLPGDSVLSIFITLSGEKIKYIGIGLVVLLLVLFGGGIWAIRRSEKIELVEKIKKRYLTFLRNWIWEKKDEIATTTGIYDKLWTKRRIPPDVLPEILKENLILYFSLSNYIKRFYIWNVKHEQVKIAAHVCEQMYNFSTETTRKLDSKQLENEIYMCRNGGVVRGIKVGLFPSHYEFLELINKVSNFLNDYTKKIISGTVTEYDVNVQNTAKSIRTEIGAIKSIIENSYKLLDERASAYGNLQPIKIQKYLVLDQCNPCGFHEHQYKFVDKGTKLINPETGEEESADKEYEVNEYNQIIEDIYNGKDGYYELQPNAVIRKVHPDEIKAEKVKEKIPYYPTLNAVSRDWEGFILNMRFGRYKFFSKSAEDYIRHLSTAPGAPTLAKPDFYKEKNIHFEPDWKDTSKPAFDRRLLLNTGFLTYTGRRYWNDVHQDITKNKKRDPYPGISILGITKYLLPLIVRDTEDIKEVNKYLQMYLNDMGNPVNSPQDALKTLDALYAHETKEGH